MPREYYIPKLKHQLKSLYWVIFAIALSSIFVLRKLDSNLVMIFSALISCYVAFELARFFLLRSAPFNLSSDGIVFQRKERVEEKHSWAEFNSIWEEKDSWIFVKSSGKRIRVRMIGFDIETQIEIAERIGALRPSPTSETNTGTVQSREIVFKPEYEKSTLLAFALGIPMFSFFIIFQFVTGVSDQVTFATIMLVACAILALFNFYRRISFGDHILVERYVLKPKVINYGDIKDYSMSTIITTKGRIALHSMVNSELVIQIIEQKLQEGKIFEEQLRGEVAFQELVAWRASMLSLPISLVIVAVMYTFDLLPKHYRLELVFILVLIVTSGVSYLILKSRQEMSN